MAQEVSPAREQSSRSKRDPLIRTAIAVSDKDSMRSPIGTLIAPWCFWTILSEYGQLRRFLVSWMLARDTLASSNLRSV